LFREKLAPAAAEAGFSPFFLHFSGEWDGLHQVSTRKGAPLMTSRLSGLAALLAVALASAAAAQDDRDDYDRTGAYLGLAGTLAVPAKLENDIEKRVQLASPEASVQVDPSLGLNARAGYRFHPHFAAEIRYEWLSAFESTLEVPPDPGVPGDPGSKVKIDDLGGWALTGDAKIYLPGDRAQAFVLLGIGALNLQSDDFGVDGTVFATRFGLGVDLYATPNIAVTLDAAYVLPTGDVGGVRPDYLSVGWGLMYRF
jgi:hypothetical protein